MNVHGGHYTMSEVINVSHNTSVIPIDNSQRNLENVVQFTNDTNEFFTGIWFDDDLKWRIRRIVKVKYGVYHEEGR